MQDSDTKQGGDGNRVTESGNKGMGEDNGLRVTKEEVDNTEGILLDGQPPISEGDRESRVDISGDRSGRVKKAIVRFGAGRPRKKPIKYRGRPPTSGVTSPRAIMPHAHRVERDIYRLLYALSPHLNSDMTTASSSKVLVQMLAILLAKVRKLDQELIRHGYFNDRGEVRNVLIVMNACVEKVVTLCKELCLTPATMAKLGIMYGDLRKQKRSLLDDEDETKS